MTAVASDPDDVDEPGTRRRPGRVRRWMYSGSRPNRIARVLNRISATVHALGVWPARLVTLEVPGRRTGRPISLPLVVADVDAERYLVSMLGEDVDWVRNVRAAGGRAVLRHGRREAVLLEEVAPGARARIIRRYLECAPGARPHMPVDRGAPLDAFDAVAAQIPVFRVTPRPVAPTRPSSS
jgi:deazaflavin-dependent oxidoreductase (nitroreductase family)